MSFWQWLKNLFQQNQPVPAKVIPITSSTVTTTAPAKPSSVPTQPIIASPQAMIEGVDVSHYETVSNWTTVKQMDAFVFMKATQGLSFVDPKFKQDWQAALSYKIPRGAYHVLDASLSPAKQAAFFLDTVGVLGPTDMLALDWEESVNKTGNAQACLVFLQAVESATKKKPIIYGSYSAIKEMNFPAEASAYPLWLARYGVPTTPAPMPWKAWTFWQFTESGKAPGIGGCDENYFNGSMADFQAFINQPQA